MDDAPTGLSHTSNVNHRGHIVRKDGWTKNNKKLVEKRQACTWGMVLRHIWVFKGRFQSGIADVGYRSITSTSHKNG